MPSWLRETLQEVEGHTTARGYFKEIKKLKIYR